MPADKDEKDGVPWTPIVGVAALGIFWQLKGRHSSRAAVVAHVVAALLHRFLLDRSQTDRRPSITVEPSKPAPAAATSAAGLLVRLLDTSILPISTPAAKVQVSTAKSSHVRLACVHCRRPSNIRIVPADAAPEVLEEFHGPAYDDLNPAQSEYCKCDEEVENARWKQIEMATAIPGRWVVNDPRSARFGEELPLRLLRGGHFSTYTWEEDQRTATLVDKNERRLAIRYLPAEVQASDEEIGEVIQEEDDHLAVRTLRNAYVGVLYGKDPAALFSYVLGAMVLGFALRRFGGDNDRVLLHTPDVPQNFLEVLSKFWTLKQVGYWRGVSLRMFQNAKQSRFLDVYTKLLVLRQTQYAKVALLDIDVLCRDDISGLFDLQAPAAKVRHHNYDHGVPFSCFDFWCDHGVHQQIGINSGVCLLEPCERTFRKMLVECLDEEHPEHIACKGPEQDYMARFYSAFGKGWTNIGEEYHFQMLNVEVPQVTPRLVHFAGGKKPWQIDLDRALGEAGGPNGYEAWVKQNIRMQDPAQMELLQQYSLEWITMLCLANQELPEGQLLALRQSIPEEDPQGGAQDVANQFFEAALPAPDTLISEVDPLKVLRSVDPRLV